MRFNHLTKFSVGALSSEEMWCVCVCTCTLYVWVCVCEHVLNVCVGVCASLWLFRNFKCVYDCVSLSHTQTKTQWEFSLRSLNISGGYFYPHQQQHEVNYISQSAAYLPPSILTYLGPYSHPQLFMWIHYVIILVYMRTRRPLRACWCVWSHRLWIIE